MSVYVACVPECRGSICCASQLIAITYSICISSNSHDSKKLPDDGRPLSKHVGACILNKAVVQFSACVGYFH
jgi:hypothetical protein